MPEDNTSNVGLPEGVVEQGIDLLVDPQPAHYCASVRLFHHAYGCAAPLEPTALDEQTRYARAQLVGEELAELLWALAAGDLLKVLDALGDTEYVLCGTIVATGYDLVAPVPATLSFTDGPPRLPHPDAVLQTVSMLYEGQSALCMALAQNKPDTVAMIAGAMLNSLAAVWAMFGVPEPLRQLVLAEVHASNMTKFGADGLPVVNEAGRVVKGPNFREPDFMGVLTSFYGPGYRLPLPRASASTPLSGGVR